MPGTDRSREWGANIRIICDFCCYASSPDVSWWRRVKEWGLPRSCSGEKRMRDLAKPSSILLPSTLIPVLSYPTIHLTATVLEIHSNIFRVLLLIANVTELACAVYQIMPQLRTTLREGIWPSSENARFYIRLPGLSPSSGSWLHVSASTYYVRSSSADSHGKTWTEVPAPPRPGLCGYLGMN